MVRTFEIRREVEYGSCPLGDEPAGALLVGLGLLGVFVEVHDGLADAGLLEQRLVDGGKVHQQLEHALADEQAGQRAVGHGRQPVAQHVEHVVLQEGQLQVALDELRHGALEQRHLAHGGLVAPVELAVRLRRRAHLLQQRRDQVVVVVDDVDVAPPPPPAPLLALARQHGLEVGQAAAPARRRLLVRRVRARARPLCRRLPLRRARRPLPLVVRLQARHAPPLHVRRARA